MNIDKIIDKIVSFPWADSIIEKRHTWMFVIFSFFFEAMAMVSTSIGFFPKNWWIFSVYIFAIVSVSFYYGGRASQFILGFFLLFQIVIVNWSIALYDTTGLVYEIGLFETVINQLSLSDFAIPYVVLSFSFTAIAFYSAVSFFGNAPYLSYIKRSKGSFIFYLRNAFVSVGVAVVFVGFINWTSPVSPYDYEGHFEGETVPTYENFGVTIRHFQQWVVPREEPTAVNQEEVLDYFSEQITEPEPSDNGIIIVEIQEWDWAILNTRHNSMGISNFDLTEEQHQSLFPNFNYLKNEGIVHTDFFSPDTPSTTRTNIFLGNRSPFQNHEERFFNFNYQNDIFSLMRKHDVTFEVYSDNDVFNLFQSQLFNQEVRPNNAVFENEDVDFRYIVMDDLFLNYRDSSSGRSEQFGAMDVVLGEDIDWSTHPNRLPLRRYFSQAMILDEIIGDFLENVGDQKIIFYSSSPFREISSYLRQTNLLGENANTPLIIYNNDDLDPNASTFKSDYDLTRTVLNHLGIPHNKNLYFGGDISDNISHPIYSVDRDHYLQKSIAFGNTGDPRYASNAYTDPENFIDPIMDHLYQQKMVDQYYFYYSEVVNEIKE